MLVSVGPVESGALIRGARLLRRIRRFTALALIAIAVVGAVISYQEITSPVALTSSIPMVLDVALKPLLTVPRDVKSEDFTENVNVHGSTRAVGTDMLVKEQISLDTTNQRELTLISQGPSLDCTTSASVGNIPCEMTINNVSYSRSQNVNQWFAVTSPALSMSQLATERATYLPNSRTNSLGFFKEISLKPLVRLGTGSTGGIATTEFRGMVSLVNLYRTSADSLLSSVYLSAIPARVEVPMALPVKVWVDSKGQVLEFQATDSARETEPPGPSSPGGLVSKTASMTLSNFNTPVPVVVPPASEVTDEPYVAHPQTQVFGTVLVRESNGTSMKEPGLLLLSIGTAADSTSVSYDAPFLYPIFTSVDKNGSYLANIIGFSTSTQPGRSDNVSAVFYPDTTTKLTCDAKTAVQFAIRATTSDFNIVCNK